MRKNNKIIWFVCCLVIFIIYGCGGGAQNVTFVKTGVKAGYEPPESERAFITELLSYNSYIKNPEVAIKFFGSSRPTVNTEEFSYPSYTGVRIDGVPVENTASVLPGTHVMHFYTINHKFFSVPNKYVIPGKRVEGNASELTGKNVINVYTDRFSLFPTPKKYLLDKPHALEFKTEAGKCYMLILYKEGRNIMACIERIESPDSKGKYKTLKSRGKLRTLESRKRVGKRVSELITISNKDGSMKRPKPESLNPELLNGVSKNSLTNGKEDFKPLITKTDSKYRIRGGVDSLYKAAEFGNIEEIKQLLDTGSDVNETTYSDGSSPLHIAIQEGHTEVARLLLDAGADVNIARHNGVTALYISSGKGYTEFVKLLLEVGADVNKAKHNGVTALYIASGKGHIEVVKVLLVAGADVNIASQNGATPLYRASEKRHADVVKLLLEAGADANKSESTFGTTPLNVAAQKGYAEIVKLLLFAGADVNKARHNGWTPLYSASRNGYTEVVRILKTYGAKE